MNTTRSFKLSSTARLVSGQGKKPKPLRSLYPPSFLLFPLPSSSTLSFLSSTLSKNSTFSRYPPPRRFCTSSSVTSFGWAETCARQSIADLSSVVSFFALFPDEEGREGRDVRGLRGPGRFGAGVAVVAVGGGEECVEADADVDAIPEMLSPVADGSGGVD